MKNATLFPLPERLNKRPYQKLEIIVCVNCRSMKVLCFAAALFKQDKKHHNVMNRSVRAVSLENMMAGMEVRTGCFR